MTAEEARKAWKAAREAEARQAERDRKSGAEKVTREVVDRAHAAAEDAIRKAIETGSMRARPNDFDGSRPEVPAAFVSFRWMCREEVQKEHYQPCRTVGEADAYRAAVLDAVASRLRDDDFAVMEVIDPDLGRGLWVSWDIWDAPWDSDTDSR